MANTRSCRTRTRAAELDLSNVKNDLRVFIQEYKDGSRDIKQLVSSEGLMTREHISASSKHTLEAIDGIQKQIHTLTLEADVHINQAQRERLLRSLKFPGFNDRRNQVFGAHEKTFEWIFVGDDGSSQEDLSRADLEDPDWEDSDLEDLDLADPSEASWDLFSNWLSSTEHIYWISGKPGSGKTTLVKYVLSHSRTTIYLSTWSPQSLIISHFFWRPGTSMQQSIKGLICSLLYQLLENSISATDYVLEAIRAGRSGVKDEDADWSVPELRSTLLKTLQSYERPICIFIDGLDEVHPKDGPMELVDLVKEISRCRSTKLCLSSRPEPILEECLSEYPHLRLQDLNKSDLRLYARDSVNLTGSIDDEAQSTSSKDDEDLIELLVDKAEGVFLWLVVAIKSINKGFTHGDTSEMIRQRINHLPGDLTRLYKDMWARACGDDPVAYRQIAALYFRLVLLSQRYMTAGRAYWPPSLLHLMLASTSVADQLLDDIDNPSDLVPESRLLQKCRAVERRLKLYCCGLIEVVQWSYGEDTVMGWYGTQYSTLWSRYGRGQLAFVHRTAKDFLTDTVDGSQILSYNSIQEYSLFLRWVGAHLAISQLYADKNQERIMAMRVNNLLRPYITLLSHFAEPGQRHGDPDWTRTISHLQDLCSSGQLLCGPVHAARFCGGVDFLNATAIFCDEHLLSRPKISNFSKSAVSGILLNVCDRDDEWFWDRNKWSFGNWGDSLITTLLCEGADPNWRGIMFHPWERTPRLSLVRTPFTAYLANILNQALWQKNLEWYEIATILGNLHAFLSRSANLSDVIHRVVHYRPINTRVYEHSSIYSAILISPISGLNYLIFAFSAYSVLKVLLDRLSTMIGQSRHGEKKNYEETISLLVRNREYLNNWSKQEHSRVIGRVACNSTWAEDFSVAEDSDIGTTGWCYWSLEEDPSGIAKEFIGEMEKCLLDSSLTRDAVLARDTRKGRVIEKALQLPWTLQAKGVDDIWQLLIALGIFARSDHETHDVQGWVEKFRRKLVADGRVVD